MRLAETTSEALRTVVTPFCDVFKNFLISSKEGIGGKIGGVPMKTTLTDHLRSVSEAPCLVTPVTDGSES